MGRLKRSCVVGSVVFHALILAMLVLGPMLLAKREEKVRVIDLVPSEVIEKLLSPAALVAPPPAPSTPKPKQPEPKKVQPKPKLKPKPLPPKPKKITPKPKPKPKPKPNPTQAQAENKGQSQLECPETGCSKKRVTKGSGQAASSAQQAPNQALRPHVGERPSWPVCLGQLRVAHPPQIHGRHDPPRRDQRGSGRESPPGHRPKRQRSSRPGSRVNPAWRVGIARCKRRSTA